MMHLLKTIVAATMFLTLAIPEAAHAATVYVMRHAAKGAGEDPGLTAFGMAQAGQVADVLGTADIRAVFATATRRAEETGAPLARRLGFGITTYDPRDLDALAAAVKRTGGSVLIIGHSNTVPDLVARFGGARPAPLAESDYGTIFVVHSASPAVNQIHLGAARR